LEKDSQDRWPSADALRRALETNTYTPPAPRAGRTRPRASAAGAGAGVDRKNQSLAPSDAGEERDWLEQRRSKSLRREEKLGRHTARRERKLEKKEQEERDIEEQAKRTGEPVII